MSDPIQATVVGPVTIITFRDGRLIDRDQIETIRRAVHRLIDAGHRNLLFDLGGVESMASRCSASCSDRRGGPPIPCLPSGRRDLPLGSHPARRRLDCADAAAVEGLRGLPRSGVRRAGPGRGGAGARLGRPLCRPSRDQGTLPCVLNPVAGDRCSDVGLLPPQVFLPRRPRGEGMGRGAVRLVVRRVRAQSPAGRPGRPAVAPLLPDAYHGRPEDLAPMFGRVCGHLGLDPSLFELDLDSEAARTIDGMAGPVQGRFTRSSGWDTRSCPIRRPLSPRRSIKRITTRYRASGGSGWKRPTTTPHRGRTPSAAWHHGLQHC